jgi:hypothetical protein
VRHVTCHTAVAEKRKNVVQNLMQQTQQQADHNSLANLELQRESTKNSIACNVSNVIFVSYIQHMNDNNLQRAI